ncbi:MAG: SPFH/Band 7/PHB domain protein [Myxococcaceae bacterium]|jgi:regulator of protease activity HflC (stomatin/prohibitin superfamily)|nr:SPFH/Band 7/PHB domain protein [Myxococcaceae bacterium]
MNTQGWLQLIGGVVLGAGLVSVASRLFKAMTVSIDDRQVALVTVFGRFTEKLSRPGLHVLPMKLFPWVEVTHVSKARDYRSYKGIHVNDSRGTTMLVDLWVELHIVDSVKSQFAVTNWDEALESVVAHAAISILGKSDFQQVLQDRQELGERLRADIAREAERWGLVIDSAFIQQIELLPEVAQQLSTAIAARLERATAEIEATGRLEVAQLEADTSKEVATLVAQARAQYPLEVGAALGEVKKTPPVLAAYLELYELSQLRPQRTVAFRGFEGAQALRSAEAAMLQAPDEPVPPVR